MPERVEDAHRSAGVDPRDLAVESAIEKSRRVAETIFAEANLSGCAIPIHHAPQRSEPDVHSLNEYGVPVENRQLRLSVGSG